MGLNHVDVAVVPFLWGRWVLGIYVVWYAQVSSSDVYYHPSALASTINHHHIIHNWHHVTGDLYIS